MPQLFFAVSGEIKTVDVSEETYVLLRHRSDERGIPVCDIGALAIAKWGASERAVLLYLEETK